MNNDKSQSNEGKLESSLGPKPDLGQLGIGISSPSRIPISDGDSGADPSTKVQRGQNWKEVEKHKVEIDGVISNLDDKLNLVLAKQEYEYLKSYNIYVKRKEKELRELIDKLNKKNSNNTLKDEKINNLEKTIQSIQDDQIRMEKEKDDQGKKIKKLVSKSSNLEQERDFLQKQVLEAKRQNKLLKLAISRLQNQINSQVKVDSKLNSQEEGIVEPQGDTFLTESKQPINFGSDRVHNTEYVKQLNEKDPYGISTMQDSKEKDTQAQTSFIGAQASYLTSGPPPAIGTSIMQSNMLRRAQTRSPQSRYRHIPTENIKFQKFMDLIYKSKMQQEDIKNEIIQYVQALETNYNDTIRDLKVQVEREKFKNKRQNFEKVAEYSQKNDLENLFVECIEEIRKDIMKRRLKNEIQNKKKFQQIDKNTEEAKEFEQSLLKLANLAKNRVKISEFTSKDRGNLLDLFVNNERTLLKMYEILFPYRATSTVANGISTNMASKAGPGVYG